MTYVFWPSLEYCDRNNILQGLLGMDPLWSERNWNVFINASLLLCSNLNQTDCCRMECSSNMRNNFRKKTVNCRVSYDVKLKYYQSQPFLMQRWTWIEFEQAIILVSIIVGIARSNHGCYRWEEPRGLYLKSQNRSSKMSWDYLGYGENLVQVLL